MCCSNNELSSPPRSLEIPLIPFVILWDVSSIGYKVGNWKILVSFPSKNEAFSLKNMNFKKHLLLSNSDCSVTAK